MKINKFSLITAAVFALGMSTANADTGTGTFALTGDFTASCSFNNPSFPLGSVDLSTYIVQAGTAFEHARVPAVINVACNSETVPWTIHNTGDSNGFNFTIGAVTDNKVCVLNDASTTALANCAKSNSASPTKISGVGSMARNVVLGIFHINPTQKAFRGAGAISGTVNLTLTF